jgi:hypothetical protein
MSLSSEATRVGPSRPSSIKYPPATKESHDSYTLSKRPWRFYVTPFERIVNHKYQGAGTEESPYLVDWLPNDPEDPQQWGAGYKWFTIAVASFATLAVALSSSAYSGGVKSLVAEFGASTELLTAGLSLVRSLISFRGYADYQFVVGFAFGPL